VNWKDIRCAQQVVTGSGPLCEPLTYDDIRDLLRLPSEADQGLITGYIASARMKLEEDSGLTFITQKRDLFFDQFPADPILVPFEPLTAVDSIKVTSLADVESTVAATVYQVDAVSSPPRVGLRYGQSWPTDIRDIQGIVMRCSIGHGLTGAAVPEIALHAMRELIRMWYAPRGAEITVAPPKWIGYDNAVRILRTRGRL
jgi:uncharacterized phiE125 gp8 family phage protein